MLSSLASVRTRTSGFVLYSGLVCALAVALGGASRDNALALALVELAALPLLGWAVLRLRRSPPKGWAAPTALAAAAAGLLLFQLAPLPYELWSRLPGSEPARLATEMAGLGRISLPVSIQPGETWRSLLALIPPMAVFLGVLSLSARERRLIAAVWIAAALTSLGLGLLQVAAGPASPLYLYERTNAGHPVGFFSNRNHQAVLLAACLPLAAAFYRSRTPGDALWQARRAAVLGLIFLVIVALGVLRSSAGLILLVPALVGAFAIISGEQPRRGRARALLGVGAACVAAIALIGVFALPPLVKKVSDHFESEPRVAIWRASMTIASEKLPLGSGVGTFDAAYRAAERLEDVGPQFVNHAHNDYLELLIETGLPGALLIGAFLLWWVRRCRSLWRGERGEDPALSRAATVVVALLLAHSLVDYPLRTVGLATLFAFACAVLVPARPSRQAGAGRAKAAEPAQAWPTPRPILQK